MLKYKILKKKYIKHEGRILYRIQALKNFGAVMKGEIGGYIEKEENLSQEGDCWIHNNAKVFDNARIFSNAKIFDNTRISDDTVISGDAIVCDNAKILGNARILGDAVISGNAIVKENQRIVTGYINYPLNTIENSLKAQLGVSFINNKVILYKRVNKIKDGVYSSLHDENFIYKKGKTVKVKNSDLSDKSCATGIHLSTSNYWNKDNTTIACEVNKKDIITIQNDKVRCKQCKVIGEV